MNEWVFSRVAAFLRLTFGLFRHYALVHSDRAAIPALMTVPKIRHEKRGGKAAPSRHDA